MALAAIFIALYGSISCVEIGRKNLVRSCLITGRRTSLILPKRNCFPSPNRPKRSASSCLFWMMAGLVSETAIQRVLAIIPSTAKNSPVASKAWRRRSQRWAFASAYGLNRNLLIWRVSCTAPTQSGLYSSRDGSPLWDGTSSCLILPVLRCGIISFTTLPIFWTIAPSPMSSGI